MFSILALYPLECQRERKFSLPLLFAYRVNRSVEPALYWLQAPKTALTEGVVKMKTTQFLLAAALVLPLTAVAAPPAEPYDRETMRQHYQAMSPEERASFRQQRREERQAWRERCRDNPQASLCDRHGGFGAHGQHHGKERHSAEERATWRARMEGLSPQERAELRNERRAAMEAQRKSFRERMRDLSTEERAELRERLRSMTPQERRQWLSEPQG